MYIYENVYENENLSLWEETCSKKDNNSSNSFNEGFSAIYGKTQKEAQEAFVNKIDEASNSELVSSSDVELLIEGEEIYISSPNGKSKLSQDGLDGLLSLLKAALAYQATAADKAAFVKAANLLLPDAGRNGEKKEVSGALNLRHLHQGDAIAPLCTRVAAASYKEMLSSKLYELTTTALEADLGRLQYEGGFNTLNYREWRFSLPDKEGELQEQLQMAAAQAEEVERDWSKAIPVVILSTSDCGKGAAKFTPCINLQGVNLRLGKSISVRHKGADRDWPEEIRNAEEKVFAALKAAAKQVIWLASQYLDDPCITTVNVCKECKIPRKHYKAAIEEIRWQFEEAGEITALDCYMQLSKAVTAASTEAKSATSRLALQDKLSLAAMLDWTEFDCI
jgi:hypothetical protein